MKKKKLFSASIVALVLSVIPLATLVPVALKFVMPDGLRTVWAAINIGCAVVGLALSLICVKGAESRSPVNILSTALSAVWALMMLGIVALALLLSAIQ